MDGAISPVSVWSERRHHMAGELGAAMTERLFELKWIERIPGGRALHITGIGLRGMNKAFGLVFRSGDVRIR